MTLTKMLHDVQTGEITEVDFTVEEVKQVEADRKINEKKNLTDKAEAEAKATAKEALLSRLGITAEEARLLLS
jgi:hypothetical protein